MTFKFFWSFFPSKKKKIKMSLRQTRMVAPSSGATRNRNNVTFKPQEAGSVWERNTPEKNYDGPRYEDDGDDDMCIVL